MKKPKIRSIVPYLVSSAALLILVIYLAKNFDRYRSLFEIKLGSLFLLLVLILIFIIQNGIINLALYQSLGAEIPFFTGMGLAIINTMANQLPFAGGLIAKGVYLKKKFEIPYSSYLGATGALYILFTSTNGIIGLGTSILLLEVKGISVPLLIWLGFSLMFTAFLLLFISFEKVPYTKKYHFLIRIEEGWRIFRNNWILLLGLLVLQITSNLVMAGRFWVVFRIFSQDISYLQCVVFSSATILTRLISISPGGIGVREGIVAGLAALFSFQPGISAVVVGFDRLFSTTMILILGIYFSYKMSLEVINPNDITGSNMF